MTLPHRTCLCVGILLAAQTLGGCNSAVSPLTSLTSAERIAGKRSALLYVSDPGTNRVSIYSFLGLSQRGEIRLRDPGGMCVDSSGNVWIIWGRQNVKISEFPHGATRESRRIKLLGAPGYDGCAVDPTTGNLAVNHTYNFDDYGYIALFKDGRGKPKAHYGPMFDPAFIGYDNAGNAFADATAYQSNLEELAAGAKSATNVTPKGMVLHSAGGVQYDGSNIAVGDADRGVIYQTSAGAIVGTTHLKGTCLVRQFFIDGATVIAPNACKSSGEVLFYSYPAGGEPITKLTGFTQPYAVVISR